MTRPLLSHSSDGQEATMDNTDWQDKLAAQQRHEHLAATVRIALGELCWVAEQHEDVADRIYGITDMLESELKETSPASSTSCS